MKLFDVEDSGEGAVNIRNVPVFQEHTDRGYNCDQTWMERCVADFVAQKAESASFAGEQYAMLPPLTIGHTPENKDAPEPPVIGFVDNLRRMGKYLLADFVGIARENWAKIKAGMFPYRSSEIVPSLHRLTNVSLLGGRYPHFALPVMKFSAERFGSTQEVFRYFMRGFTMNGMQPNQPAPNMQQGQQAGGCDVNQLAQAVAPLVAKMIAEGQANGPGGPMQNAGAYRDENGKVFYTDTEGKVFYIEKGRQVYAAEDEGKPKVKAEVSSEEPVSDTNRTPHLDKEANDAGKDKNSAGGAQRYGKTHQGKKFDAKMAGTREYDEEHGDEVEEGDDYGLNPKALKYIAGLKAQNEKLAAAVVELQRNNEASNQSAKRAMLAMKLKGLISEGYAIGADKIDRHVQRMIGMDVKGVEEYLEDIKGAAPKVEIQRHGTRDIVRRPGSETDAEKYLLEHPEMAAVGIDKSVIELSEFLGG